MTAAAPTAGPVYRQLEQLRARHAAGPWLDALHDPRPGCDWDQADSLTAVYLGLDRDARIRYCGQSVRDSGVGQRVREHLANEQRRDMFATFVVVALHDLAPYEVVDAIEGRLADVLGLRGPGRGRRWPSAAAWPELVADAEAKRLAAEVAGVSCYQ